MNDNYDYYAANSEGLIDPIDRTFNQQCPSQQPNQNSCMQQTASNYAPQGYSGDCMQQTASNYAPQGNPNGYMQQQPVCQGNYAGMPTPMDFYKIISVNQESMRYQGFLLSQNAQLAQSNLNLQFENAKLNLKKGDILDKERLVDDGSRLSYCVEYDDFNSRSTVVAEFFIKSAVMLKWDPRYKKEDGYLLMMSDDKSILIYKKDIEKGKLSRLFNSNGYSINSIRGRDLESLLVNYIANKLDQSEENICYIPYTTGWVDNKYYMFPNNALQNTEMPFAGPLGSKTFEVAVASIDESINEGFSCYGFIKNETKRVILLGMLISSLLYTPLKKENKELRKILVVSGEKNILDIVSSLFLKVFDREKGNVCINQNSKIINKELLSTQDCMLVIDGRIGKDMKDYMPQTNLGKFSGLFCKNTLIDDSYFAERDLKYGAAAQLAILSDTFEPYIDDENYIVMSFERDDMTFSGELNISEYAGYIGNSIWHFIRYMSNPDTHMKKYKIPHMVLKENIRSCSTILTSLRAFDDFISYACSGMSLQKLLKLSRNPYVIAAEYFCSETYYEGDMAYYVQRRLTNLIKAEELTVYNSRELSIDAENIDETVIFLNSEVWITEECFKDKILKKSAVSEKAVLDIIKSEELLKAGKKRNVNKRRVYLNGQESRPYFLILDRKVLSKFDEIYCDDGDEKGDFFGEFENWKKYVK